MIINSVTAELSVSVLIHADSHACVSDWVTVSAVCGVAEDPPSPRTPLT